MLRENGDVGSAHDGGTDERGPGTGRTRDARGRTISQIDPVKLHLLGQDSIIPGDRLRAMADEILPGARRQRLLQVISVSLGVLLVIGGNIVYFGFFRPWPGLDPVNTSIYVLQAALILGGPVLVYLQARRGYAARVSGVMLKYRHCPHCGYDLHGLPDEASGGITVCPECGCAWRLDPSARHLDQ